jgi:hypothetical protein
MNRGHQRIRTTVLSPGKERERNALYNVILHWLRAWRIVLRVVTADMLPLKRCPKAA